MFQKECFKLQVQSTNTSEICKCWDSQAAAVEVKIIIMLRYGRWFSIPKSVFDSAKLLLNLIVSWNSVVHPRQSRRKGAWPRKNKMSSQPRRTSVKRSICSCLFLWVGNRPLKKCWDNNQQRFSNDAAKWKTTQSTWLTTACGITLCTS